MKAAVALVLLALRARAGVVAAPDVRYGSDFGHYMAAALRDAKAWRADACLVSFKYTDSRMMQSNTHEEYQYQFRAGPMDLPYEVRFRDGERFAREISSSQVPARCIAEFPLELGDAIRLGRKHGLETGTGIPLEATFWLFEENVELHKLFKKIRRADWETAYSGRLLWQLDSGARVRLVIDAASRKVLEKVVLKPCSHAAKDEDCVWEPNSK